MKIETTTIPGVLLVEPKFFGDERGWFTETYSQQVLKEAGFDKEFVQDNHSYSKLKGTIRGLHFQTNPFGQDKLVRCVRGSILDVVVDIRHGSPTFGRHVSVVLDAKSGRQLLAPIGMAHGFCTLENDCEVVYKVTNLYSKSNDCGIRWNDPALRIEWPVSEDNAQLSEKDSIAPFLSDTDILFEYL